MRLFFFAQASDIVMLSVYCAITGAIIITSLPLARARKAEAGAPMLKCASPPATAASDLAPPPVRTMSGSMFSASK